MMWGRQACSTGRNRPLQNHPHQQARGLASTRTAVNHEVTSTEIPSNIEISARETPTGMTIGFNALRIGIARLRDADLKIKFS
jgi:hypothetical protein